MSGLDGVPSQEASVANEEKMQKMQEKVEVLERMIEQQRLRAEKDAPREGTEGGGRWGDERRSGIQNEKTDIFHRIPLTSSNQFSFPACTHLNMHPQLVPYIDVGL